MLRITNVHLLESNLISRTQHYLIFADKTVTVPKKFTSIYKTWKFIFQIYLEMLKKNQANSNVMNQHNSNNTVLRYFPYEGVLANFRHFLAFFDKSLSRKKYIQLVNFESIRTKIFSGDWLKILHLFKKESNTFCLVHVYILDQIYLKYLPNFSAKQNLLNVNLC